ncbi:hypothetical protein JYB64_12135 [Algoriphagus aestuarii]|nr:hypothetical protein [Algoriphagus aestuarii]
MTREAQLLFCKKCLHREMNMEIGLICSLTREKAAFTNTCPTYSIDEQAAQELIENDFAEPAFQIDQISESKLKELRMEQNFPLAVVGGFISGILGAILWGMITVATNFQIGYMAIAIGAGVGFTIRYLGKGVDQSFGIAGGFIALFSCILGNFLSIIGFIANEEGLGFLETLLIFDYSYTFLLMEETFQLVDLLFYSIAAYEGYKFSFRVLSNQQVI